MSWDAPAKEVGPAPGVKFAGHGARFLAYMVDTLIFALVMFGLTTLVAAVLYAGAAAGDFRNPAFSAAVVGGLITWFLVLLVLALAYFPFFWTRWGQTPGMRLFGLFVVRDNDGGRISGGQAIVRLIGMWVSAVVIYIGFVWIFIDARHRGWHDLMAGTVMVERTRR
jgi:uncharacterized RDD family membrane protein YckC